MTLNEAQVLAISLSGEFTERNEIILENIIGSLQRGFPDFVWVMEGLGRNPYIIVSVKDA